MFKQQDDSAGYDRNPYRSDRDCPLDQTRNRERTHKDYDRDKETPLQKYQRINNSR